MTRTLSALFLLAAMLTASAEETHVYFGTYTKDSESKGIYHATLDLATGQLSEPELALEAQDPSFLALHPTKNLLYYVNELGDDPSKVETVRSARIDPESGAVTAFGHARPSQGEHTCHISLDPAGSTVFVASYTGGNIASFPLLEVGSLGEIESFYQHSGDAKPHAHSINVSPDGTFALVADLGLDQILVYKLDGSKLTPNDPPFAKTPEGGGPRHLAFHPSGKYVFANNERTSSVTAYSYDPKAGTLAQIESHSTLPKGFDGKNSTAECLVHPTGKWVYVSNRGHDSIAAFAIDQDSGALTPVGIQPTGGKTPRGFGIDPTGTYLLAAGQNSNSVHTLKIDPKSGSLTPAATPVTIQTPVCVRFFQPK